MSKWLKRAKKVAQNSTYKKRFRHGAVLVRGGKVINEGWNSNNYKNFYHRFSEYGIIHAEADAIYNISKQKTKNSTLYVARINCLGELRISKPCSGCIDFAKFCGIKKIIFSIDGLNIGEIKL